MFLYFTVPHQYHHISPITDKCKVEINGIIQIKNIGETWNTSDPCLKYTCDYGPNGIAESKQFKQRCLLNCSNEYELVIASGQCCGHCEQRKCKYDGEVYTVGETWKSPDNCTFYECTRNTEMNTINVSSYRKSCPKLLNCPQKNIVYQDCCQYCNEVNKYNKDIRNVYRTSHKDITTDDDDTTNDDIKEEEEDEIDYMNEETYTNHQCTRDCKDNEMPMTCKYTFKMEWYETLSKACFDCPTNQTDCFRPHCIPGDGVRRSVLVVNRMMPGPTIQVCNGDTVIVDVKNHLLGESTTIHWHGLHQRETPYMDGVPHISQCAIPPGSTFRYEFLADNPGTHFWHSHIGELIH